MAIVLGGVTLNSQIVWVDQFKTTPINQVAKRTLGGQLVVYQQNLTEGREITLEAISDQGWLTRTQVDQVTALSEVIGATYTLVIGEEVQTVIFRHTDGLAVEFTPLVFRVNSFDTEMSEDGDFFTGFIRLLSV